MHKPGTHRFIPLLSLATVFVCLETGSAGAQGIDPMIEGAKLCTRHLQRYERAHGIPAHLLSAIASTESGRYHSGLKISLPWPWTINAEGKGYYFNSKSEAIAAANKLRSRGVQSMDVGCMQVNLYHHPDAFTSLSNAFEPESNVAYAASFLRDLYQEEGSWKKAASDYHSRTPQLGHKYAGLVYNSWHRIVDKLRSARLNVPDSSVNGLREMAKTDSASYIARASAPKRINVAKQDKESASYKSANAKTVQIDNKPKRNNVIIVKPEIKVVDAGSVLQPNKNPAPEPMVMASAADTPENGRLKLEPQAKIIRLDSRLVERHSVNAEPVKNTEKKTGPSFIFND